MEYVFVLTNSRTAGKSQHSNILDLPSKQFSRISLAVLVLWVGVRPGLSICVSFIGHKNSTKSLFLPYQQISKFSVCPSRLWVRKWHSHPLTPPPKRRNGDFQLRETLSKEIISPVCSLEFFFRSLFMSLIWLRGTGVMEQIPFVNSAYGVCIGRDYLFPL